MGYQGSQAVDPVLFPWPVMNQAAQQEVSGGRASEASSTLPNALYHWHYHLNHPLPDSL